MDLLDVKATLFYDELGKRVEISCSLTPNDNYVASISKEASGSG